MIGDDGGPGDLLVIYGFCVVWSYVNYPIVGGEIGRGCATVSEGSVLLCGVYLESSIIDGEFLLS